MKKPSAGKRWAVGLGKGPQMSRASTNDTLNIAHLIAIVNSKAYLENQTRKIFAELAGFYNIVTNVGGNGITSPKMFSSIMVFAGSVNNSRVEEMPSGIFTVPSLEMFSMAPDNISSNFDLVFIQIVTPLMRGADVSAVLLRSPVSSDCAFIRRGTAGAPCAVVTPP